jgi:hypothetical protein
MQQNLEMSLQSILQYNKRIKAGGGKPDPKWEEGY